MKYQTTLAQVTAKWHPALRLGEYRACRDLEDQKRHALDFSPTGIQTLLQRLDDLQEGENHIHRLKTFRAARTGLQQLAAGHSAPDDWWPIWTIFCYWEAAAEIIAARPAPTPAELEWLAMTPLERLSRIVSRQTR